MAPDPPWSTGKALGRAIPAPRADGLVLDAAADPCGHLGDPSVPGLPVPDPLGFERFAPTAQFEPLLSMSAGEDCPKQCPSP